MNHRRAIVQMLIVWVAMGSLAGAQQTCTWKGGVGNWFDSDQWTNGVPGAGDSAIVTAGTVWLDAETAALAGFDMRGGTLVFSNWNTRLVATSVKLDGGSVTHAVCDTNAAPGNIHRVYFDAGEVFIGTAGRIDADARGYRGGIGQSVSGQGPGGGRNGGGGGYGGEGANGAINAAGPGGPRYGSAADPDDPGSGGGGSGAHGSSDGRPGGGAVRIEASGTVTVNGRITASAARNVTTLVGQGSGGAIAIQCHRFAATNGVIRADGGGRSGSYWHGGGSGGGGRIAIVYDPAAQAALNATDSPSVYLSADGGNWINHDGMGRSWHKGRSGSIYLPDTGFYPSTNRLHGGRIEIPGFMTWSPPALTFSNGLTEFPAGFELTVTGDVTVLGHGGGFELSNGTFQVAGDLMMRPDMYGYTTRYAGVGDATTVGGDAWIERGEFTFHALASGGPTLALGADCTLTNGGRLRVVSAVTNAVSPPYGALVAIGRMLSVATASWVYPVAHAINGGAPRFRMAQLRIALGGGFNADAQGFAGGNLPQGVQGDGPGGGKMYGGGGHGGKGGDRATGQGGAPYGSSNAPVAPGSGGGTWGNDNGNYGGSGGGAIWIEVERNAVLDGTVSANGQTRTDYGGGGSGGAIYLRCRTVNGAGLLRANGGGARPGGSDGSGSGGGGRIAVWRVFGDFNGSASVEPGAVYPDSGREGAAGTIVWGLRPPAGVVLQAR